MTAADRAAPTGTVSAAVPSTRCVALGPAGSMRRQPGGNPRRARNRMVVLIRWNCTAATPYASGLRDRAAARFSPNVSRRVSTCEAANKEDHRVKRLSDSHERVWEDGRTQQMEEALAPPTGISSCASHRAARTQVTVLLGSALFYR